MVRRREGVLGLVGRLTVLAFVVGCSSTPPAGTPAAGESTGTLTTPGTGETPGATSTTGGGGDIPMGGPSRADLIMQSYAAGEIDLPTALLYRAYSALGLPGAPDEFSTGVPTRDDDVFQQMALLKPTLPAEMQQKYTPLLVRPTDPQSVFAAQPVALAGGVAFQEPEPTLPPPCHGWTDSVNADSRFKVWRCTDSGLATDEDMAVVVGMLQSVWDDMTKAEPDGMGKPLSDQYEAADANVYGGDGRIDFYILPMGHGVFRNGPNQVPTKALAVAYTDLPYTADGKSSGFVVLNEDRLADPGLFKQDLVHEFFHVLQFAHTITATADGGLGHWFKEASATWAETHFDPADSADTHGWFTNVFQVQPVGLESTDESHHYAAYIWPFFMEQEAKAQAVFNAWEAIGGVPAGDLDFVTRVISDQLSIEDHFHDFALRNLDIGEPLASAGIKRYNELDGRFPQGVPPKTMVEANVQPGEPNISPSSAAPLAADYYHFTFGPAAKEVSVSIGGVTPGEARDGDALVQVGSSWVHRPVSDTLKMCEDDAGGNIDQIYLVVSDHDRKVSLSGSVEASAKEDCSVATGIVGDITWDEQVVTDPSLTNGVDITDKTSGSAHIHALWDETAGWQIQNDSRFTMHYEITNCSPTADFAGPLTQVDSLSSPSDGTGTVSVQGGPQQDLSIVLDINASWTGSCDYGTGPGEPGEIHAGHWFPGCNLNTWATALWDSSSSQYVVRCQPGPDLLGTTYTVSGTVDGMLTPEAGASPPP